METTSETMTPRIYVACLAAYNHGILHGQWIKADREAWAIYDDIALMLKASPISDAEEWAIHDYEGFEGVRSAEYAGIDGVADMAAFIAEHAKLGAELIAHFSNLEEAREALEDCYHGAFSNLADYMQDVTGAMRPDPRSLALLYRLAGYGAGCRNERRPDYHSDRA